MIILRIPLEIFQSGTNSTGNISSGTNVQYKLEHLVQMS